jgi:hypothetical protein
MTITKALRELDESPLPPGRIRRPGGGRRSLVSLDPGLLGRLEELVDPLSRGDPQSPLRWTVKSTRVLASELTASGRSISHEKVAQLLRQMDFSLQSNRKIEEGADHPDRDAQFRHINAAVRRALAEGQPVISVDTKKKELIGNFVNGGKQWKNSKSPRRVNTYDFPDASVPRAYPDLGRNTGLVNIGTDHDTSAFAVASIRGWWRVEGRKLYPKAGELLITADGGGGNGYRRRQWKLELQRLADDIGHPIKVCHFPPGTSKWNKVEHRLFSFISSNWRGEPLCDDETIVRLIAATTTAKGLTVSCRLDRRRYATGRQVTDEEMGSVNLVPDRFHGEWNYTIRPREE